MATTETPAPPLTPEEVIVKKLVDLMSEPSPNVHQAICSLYDIHTKFTEDILNSYLDHFQLPFIATECPENMEPSRYFFIYLPIAMFLFNSQNMEALKNLMENLICQLNRTKIPASFDRLSAKLYFYFSLSSPDPLSTLLSAYRRCCDMHFHQSQATVVNCILKNYIDAGGYTLALSFLKHCNFPNDASPAQLGRYHFFVGHLKAITLDYASAQHHLQLSLRRAPQNRHSENFRGLVQRHLMVVMMLQGQIPSRATLLDAPLYLELARAIMAGDIIGFQNIQAHQEFAADGLGSLIPRLRSSVILAGLTLISHCYSRISFSDIAEMLHIGSAEDAEGFCAKAASGGLIEGVIDHENGCLISTKSQDDMGSGFGERIHKDIQDCFGIREDTQRIMHEEAINNE